MEHSLFRAPPAAPAPVVIVRHQPVSLVVLDQGGFVALAQQQAVGKGRPCQPGLVAAHIEGERLDKLTRLDVALILLALMMRLG